MIKSGGKQSATPQARLLREKASFQKRKVFMKNSPLESGNGWKKKSMQNERERERNTRKEEYYGDARQGMFSFPRQHHDTIFHYRPRSLLIL